MKSRTSFFNRTVLKKDITRFAPVWALYTIFLIVLFLSGQRSYPILTANAIANTLCEMAIFNLIYGGLCANILFGDLFQSRMCNALHAMPMRRESWFCTHVLSGLLFCVIPNLIGSVFLMFLLQEYFYMALIWLGVSILQFLFFFGVGVFSVMCAGNRLGMAAVYLIINFFSILVYALVKEVYEPLLYGIEVVSDAFEFFCPVYYLSANDLLSFNYDYDNDRYINGRITGFQPEIWGYLFAVVGIGVVLLLLAMLLYRKRRLECAGDFLAIRGLAPIFQVIYTLACGVFLYALSSVFGFAVNYVLMAIGIIVGFFTGCMFLERTVQVFRKKIFVSFAVFAVLLAASLVLAKVDPLGLTWYVPDTDEVAYVQVYRDSQYGVYRNNNQDDYQLESTDEINTFRQVHSQLMAERGEKTDGLSRMYIHYRLKNGREVIRYYAIDEKTAAYDTLRMYFSDYRYLFNTENWNEVANSITRVEVNLMEEYGKASESGMPIAQSVDSMEVTDPAKVAQFMEALRKDCDAGNMAQAHTFHVGEYNLGWCYLSSNVFDEEGHIIANGNLFVDLTIYPGAEHTTAVIEKWLAETLEAQ